MNQSGAATYYGTQTEHFGIYGIVVAGSAVQVPRADVYVQYVDEGGNLILHTKILVLDDADRQVLVYTTTGLDSNTHQTIARRCRWSASATGNSTTADIVVTWCYHYTSKWNVLPKWQDSNGRTQWTHQVQKTGIK